MRRKEFLALTGLSVAAHAGMVRKNLLPFAEDEAGGWSDYSARQAYLTTLALALAPMVGGQPEAARRVVDFPLAAWAEFARHLLSDDLPDVFAASFATGPTSRSWSFGRLQTVLQEPAVAFPNVRAIGVLNLSEIAREIAARAERAGIRISPTFDVDVEGEA